MYPAEYAFRADEGNLKKYMERLIKEKISTSAPSSVIHKSLNKCLFKNIFCLVDAGM